METWKAFEQNPISHSAAHHIVAIAELLEEYGYARVSDVARLLEITRGSVSVTLKGLKQRGLVTEDDRRFLGLSEVGAAFAQSVRARKVVMKKLFEDVLGVDAERADRDTCKIEHLVSPSSALHALRFLRFALCETAERKQFVAEFLEKQQECGGDPAKCCTCDDFCLEARLMNSPGSQLAMTKDPASESDNE